MYNYITVILKILTIIGTKYLIPTIVNTYAVIALKDIFLHNSNLISTF